MLRHIARRSIPVLAALLGLLAALVAPPAHAADIGVHDLETASVPAEYRQFAPGSDGLDFDSIEWDDGAWMTYRFKGAAYRYPVKPDAGLTIPNVGKWTDEDGTTRQIDMRLSVKEGGRHRFPAPQRPPVVADRAYRQRGRLHPVSG